MPFGAGLFGGVGAGAWGGMFMLAAESPWAAIEKDLQRQYIVSLTRLILVLICPGLVWLLANSTYLNEKKRNAAIVAGLVRLLFSLVADVALVHAGVYHYTIETMLYQGVPVDPHIVLGCVLGTGLALMWEEAMPLIKPLLLGAAAALAIAFNRWCAGAGQLIVPVGADYATYDLIVQCALPVITVTFYHFVEENRALIFRSIIYALGYFLLFYFLLPSMILSTGSGDVFFQTEQWRFALAAVAVLSVPGALAAGQFAISGRGTPLPLDPTHKLIITGPYAYVRNPMQISCFGVAVVWAWATQSTALWIYSGVLLVALQFTRNYEEDDLHRRFGDRYKKYCKNVKLWLPRLRAYEEE